MSVESRDLQAGDGWSREVLSALAVMDAHVRAAAGARERRGDGSLDAISPLAKFPARPFDYADELERLDDGEPAGDEEMLGEIDAFFRGALRPESPFCLFNSDFRPTVEATAAACLTVMNNVNGLMDAFGGESLLVEQKVARTVGRWAGWPSAYGISCNGGKITMFYALRCALSRVQPDSSRSGLNGRVVVLCSAGAHYSVEHVAALTGIGSDNVWRVAVDSLGAMRQESLAAMLARADEAGASVAAVVCSGGTTIDFCCDDTAAVCETIDRFLESHPTAHMPYLHFDGVIGWAYLSFRDLSPAALERAVPDLAARERIAAVLARCTELERFDSMGADFHKTGLCPYPSSFFIAREARFMDELGDGNYVYGPEDLRFGSFRAYRYTLENSRPMMGVLAAWVNLRRLGRSGLRDYVCDLHRSRAGLESAITDHGEFRVLNGGSLGWEVVAELPLGMTDASGQDAATTIAFIEHCWQLVRDGHEMPLISIVPEYHVDHDPARSRIAFLIYPMRDIAVELREAAVRRIAEQVRLFRDGRRDGRADAGWQKPIR